MGKSQYFCNIHCLISALISIAVADSLLECMEIQGLDDFISYIQAAMSDYLRLLNTTTDFHLTAFVPTNAALRQAQEMNLIQRLNDTLFNLSMMVGNHLVEGNVTIESLKQHGAKIYTTLEGRHLHRVSISFDDRSFVYYPPNPYLLNPTPTIIVSVTLLKPLTISLHVSMA